MLRVRHPNIKVLYLREDTDDTAARSGTGEALAPVIQKPFTPLALAHKVRAVLDGAS